jgi:hypothetical protein
MVLRPAQRLGFDHAANPPTPLSVLDREATNKDSLCTVVTSIFRERFSISYGTIIVKQILDIQSTPCIPWGRNIQ